MTDKYAENEFLTNDQVTQSGYYVLNRTDDLESTLTIVKIAEFKGEFFMVEGGKIGNMTVTSFDDECRWKFIW